jgi:antitoxin VapB
MAAVGKIFMSGGSQAVRIPMEFRFEDCREVYIFRDELTGNLILSQTPQTWANFFKLREELGPLPEDFMADRQDLPSQDRELF